MTAIPVHHTKTDEERAWDGPGEVAKLDEPITKSTGQGMFAWYDPNATDDDGDGYPDIKGGYKFPHHFVEDGKPGVASIRGVNNALARLSSADIPDDERPATEKHLNEHRKDAGLEDWVEAPVRSRQPIRIVEGSAKPYTPFWSVRAATTEQPAEIDFFGEISEFAWWGDEVTPRLFKQDLARLGGKPVTIRLHSPGGDIFAAAAIRAMLIDYPGTKTVKIMGLAASAAVAIALAGDEIQIFDTAYMMVHNPGYLLLLGWIDAEFMRKVAEDLDLFREGLLNAYEARTGLDRAAIGKLMDDETWMTAQQAVEMGFADKVISGGKAPAAISAKALAAFSHVPAAVIRSVKSGQAPGVKQPSEAMQARRARLEAAKVKDEGVETMSAYIRKLQAERAAAMAQAQALVEKADAEERELTEDERKQYVALLGEGPEVGGTIGALDAKIAAENERREQLRKAAAVQFGLPKSEKPEGDAKPTQMKRSEFEKLGPEAQHAFMQQAGAKLTDD